MSIMCRRNESWGNQHYLLIRFLCHYISCYKRQICNYVKKNAENNIQKGYLDSSTVCGNDHSSSTVIL